MDNKKPIRLAAGYRAFYGKEYIHYSIKSIYEHVEKIVVAISHIPQAPSLKRYKPDITSEFIKKFTDKDKKIEVIEGSWGSRCFWLRASRYQDLQAKHYNAVLNYIRDKYPQFNYLLILDTDEIFTDESIGGLKKGIEEHPEALEFRMSCKTYWKGLHYIMQEDIAGAYLTQPVAVKVIPGLQFIKTRQIADEKSIITLPESVYYHHPSYARSSEEILKKIRTFGHAREIRKNWYKDIWEAWDKNRNLTDMHPLFGGTWWKKVIRIEDEQVPRILRNHPYFAYDTVDDFEKAMKDKSKDLDLWVAPME